MTERIYPKGIRTFSKHGNAPEFILGTAVIEPETLIEWIKSEGKQYLTDYKGKHQLRLQVLKSKDGNGINFQVDTYKPTAKTSQSEIKDDLPF